MDGFTEQKEEVVISFPGSPSTRPPEDELGATFRAEKRSAQASAHPLSQAQGGLFCVLTVLSM